MSGIQACFSSTGPGFTLDVDLACPGAASPRCSATRARARPRCCAASPGWSARPRASSPVQGEVWQDDDARWLPTHRARWAMCFRRPACSRTCRCWATCAMACAAHRAPPACSLDRRWRPAGHRPAAGPQARSAVRRRTPARGIARALAQPAPAADGRAAGRARPASASRRSCPTWSACTTSWTFRCSTSATRPTRWRAGRPHGGAGGRPGRGQRRSDETLAGSTCRFTWARTPVWC
jgi:hypothetical protein